MRGPTEREQRDKVAGAIMRAVALGGAGEILRVTNDVGERPVVVALEHELVSDVLHRVDWNGGYANLFVVDLEVGTMVRASVMPPESSLLEGDAESFGAVHGDATIGMLLANVATTRAGLTMHVRLPSSRADLSQIGHPEAIPA